VTKKTELVSKTLYPEQSPKRELADLLVDYLAQIGVEYVFGVPGGAIEHLYSALARSMRRGGPRPIVARHETGAAFMADGYYRETGKLGVCCTTTGPGTTNIITGVASAYENQIPMLVISAQTALAHFGRGASQESSCTGIDTVGLLRYCTRYSTLISHADQFEHKLTTAIMTAFGSPNGPAHISIPWDILRSPCLAEEPNYDLASLTISPSLIDVSALHRLCQDLEQAKKLVFVIGGGCGEAIAKILELAVSLNATVLATHHGKGFISPYHPLFKGITGFAGHRTAQEILADEGVDTILAIGTALGETDSNGWDSRLLLNKRLLHIDSVEQHLMRSPMARLQVRGRILSIFEYLLQYFNGPSLVANIAADIGSNKSTPPQTTPTTENPVLPFRLDAETEYVADSTPIKPQRLMRELARLFPSGTRFLSDTGNVIAWAVHYLHPSWQEIPGPHAGSGGMFRHSAEFVSMTWSLGASIGTALGNPRNPVVCLIGDGSLLMSGQEITVAVQEKLTIILVVLNDAALGMVKHGQRLTRSEPIGFELPEIDYSAYARAMGADGHIIRSPQDLLSLDIEAICRKRGPTLLDVRIDAEEVPPIATRVKILGAAE
jgi:acetolactate synthase-1/2/3 large subunit